MFDPKEFAIGSAKPLPVYLLLDVSGSMRGEKINNLNKATYDMISSMADEEKMEVEILISIITFGSNINVHLPATSASHVKWKDLTAYGETKMGGALKKAKEMIEDKEITPSRSYRPTIVLVSDGRPGDVWEEPLNDLAKTGRSQKCDRMAIAIGQDADENVLKQFIDGTEHDLFYANNAMQLHEFFRYVTMSVTTRTRSQDPNQIPSANNINLTLETEPAQVPEGTDNVYSESEW